MAGSRSGSRLPSSPDNQTIAAVDRITVALVAKAAADLQNLHERTRLSKTDIVNRAISLYEFVDAELSAGAELVVRSDGQEHLIKLL